MDVLIDGLIEKLIDQSSLRKNKIFFRQKPASYNLSSLKFEAHNPDEKKGQKKEA